MQFKRSFVLTGIALASLGLAACKDEPRAQTETTEKRVTADGTTIETKSESDIRVNEHGQRTGTVETTTTVDPEGLMNKEKVEESYEEIQD